MHIESFMEQIICQHNPEFTLKLKKKSTRSASEEGTYYLSVPYPLGLARAEIPTITAGTP